MLQVIWGFAAEIFREHVPRSRHSELFTMILCDLCRTRHGRRGAGGARERVLKCKDVGKVANAAVCSMIGGRLGGWKAFG